MWIGNLPCSRHCTDGFVSSESDKVGRKGPKEETQELLHRKGAEWASLLSRSNGLI